MPSSGPRTFIAGKRTVRIGAFPVGVEMVSNANWPARRSVRSSFVRGGSRQPEQTRCAMIIGVDRLDYSKGIALRIEAFERFLTDNPPWRGECTYLQITPTSRGEIKEYADMARRISETVGRVNGKYGEAAWTPIRYLNRPYSRSALAGLYRSSRAALVTPLRDGMNLVAKEFVAAQDAEDPGVLILSRFAGASVECQSALLVNPYDAEGVAAAIAQALSMPLDERVGRHNELVRVLTENDIKFWGERFIAALKAEDSGQPAKDDDDASLVPATPKLPGACREGLDSSPLVARGYSEEAAETARPPRTNWARALDLRETAAPAVRLRPALPCARATCRRRHGCRCRRPDGDWAGDGRRAGRDRGIAPDRGSRHRCRCGRRCPAASRRYRAPCRSRRSGCRAGFELSTRRNSSTAPSRPALQGKSRHACGLRIMEIATPLPIRLVVVS